MVVALGARGGRTGISSSPIAGTFAAVNLGSMRRSGALNDGFCAGPGATMARARNVAAILIESLQ
jgi:hypothetical protein